MFRSLLAAIALFASATLAQPTIVPASTWGSKPGDFPESMAQIPDRIVLHHAGVSWNRGSDPAQKLRDLQSWGIREKGWIDVPYHYLITPDGQIFEGRDWHYQPDSNTSYSLKGVLNVELFGNFETDLVSSQQLNSLVQLLAYLCQTHGLEPARITSHRLMAPGQTVCPGRDLQRYLAGPLPVWTVQAIHGQPRMEFWLFPPPAGSL